MPQRLARFCKIGACVRALMQMDGHRTVTVQVVVKRDVGLGHSE